MNSIVDDVKKLPLSERADLLLALQNDTEISEYLQATEADKILFSEIARRDAAFKNGEMQLNTIDDLKSRLQNRRDAL